LFSARIHRQAALRQHQLGHGTVGLAGRRRHVHHHEHQIGIGHRAPRGRDHVFLQARVGRWMPGVSTKITWALGQRVDAQQAIAGSLGARRNRGQLHAHPGVEQRRFANVGLAYQGHKAAAVVGGNRFP
jgi:hypothetical protein